MEKNWFISVLGGWLSCSEWVCTSLIWDALKGVGVETTQSKSRVEKKRKIQALLHTFLTLFPRYPSAQCYSSIRGFSLWLLFPWWIIKTTRGNCARLDSPMKQYSSINHLMQLSMAQILTYIRFQQASSLFRCKETDQMQLQAALKPRLFSFHSRGLMILTLYYFARWVSIGFSLRSPRGAMTK